MPSSRGDEAGHDEAETDEKVDVACWSPEQAQVVEQDDNDTDPEEPDHKRRHPPRADLELCRYRRCVATTRGFSLACGGRHPALGGSALGGHSAWSGVFGLPRHSLIVGLSARPLGRYLGGMVRVLVIDNYDSFVYNLVQYIGELGAQPLVYRNDAISVGEAADLRPDGVLVSPGPGRPEEAGVSMHAIDFFAGRVPVLGVCLGHQCIGALYGASVVRNKVMHGKTSRVTHDGRGIFESIPNPFVATRYHSLVVEPTTIPPDLEVTATSGDGTVMGVRHRRLVVEGVQFHPESILTDDGHRMVANWVDMCA